MGSVKSGSIEALKMLRALPRISLNNIRNTGQPKKHKRGRGQHGGDKHGDGNKGSGQRMNHMRLGYETGNNPFYLRFPHEPYYQGHHMRKQYPPLSLLQLQKMIDTDRIDISKPVDLAVICNTGLYSFKPDQMGFGVHLTDEGADTFKAKLNIEVQMANEGTIAAIEKNGGVITTAYYDIHSLWLLRDPQQFFKKGEPIPRRMMPSQDVIMYYSDPANRGYLADPEKIAFERLSLSQKFGYKHIPVSEDDPMFEVLAERKDPRQIFYGLEPGWIINLIDKEILKPKNEYLETFYKS